MKVWPWLLVIAVAVGCSKEKPKPERKEAAHEARAKQLVAELGELGLAMDASGLSIEVKQPHEARADLDFQQDLFFPATYFAGMHHLHQRLGLVTARDETEFRRMAVEGITQTMHAYYQPNRKALVFLETALDQLIYMDALVAHELGHAFQDARPGGLTTFLGAHKATLEASTVAQCLIEGEAEIIAAAVLLARSGRGLDTLTDLDLEDGFERVMSGTSSLVYSVGRRALLTRFRAGGWEAVRRAVREPPASTEQLVHPEKADDHPTSVELAQPTQPGVSLIHDDVLGELILYSLMLDQGVPDREAFLAAAGWDGDRIQVWSVPDQEPAIAWRIVWDREDDATQFESVFPRGRFSLRRHGRITDLFSGPPTVSPDAWLPPPERMPEDAADAVSTAQVEGAYDERRAAGPTIADGMWIHERLGVSIPVPPGWLPLELQGVVILSGGAADGFADNITVTGAANINGLDLEGFRQENQDTLGQLDSIRLIRNEVQVISGQKVLLFEYEGLIPGATQRLHFVGFLVPRGHRYVIVTITVLAKRWSDVREAVADVLARAEVK